MIQTKRILNVIVQVEANTWFTMATDRDRMGAANTRDSRDITRIVERNSNTELRRNFYSQRVPRSRNSLNQNTRQCTSVLAFKACAVWVAMNMIEKKIKNPKMSNPW